VKNEVKTLFFLFVKPAAERQKNNIIATSVAILKKINASTERQKPTKTRA